MSELQTMDLAIVQYMNERTVNLLLDSKGVYGIRCQSVEPPSREVSPFAGRDENSVTTIITRPDRLVDQTISHAGTLYQFVPPRFIHKNSTEAQMAQLLHYDRYGPGYIDRDKFDRKRWHGLRVSSTQIMNSLIAQALEVANKDAVKMVRRYPAIFREDLYKAASLDNRALQLMDTFPLLAVYIYVIKKDCQLKDMVNKGRLLRDIAIELGIPFSLKRLKPGVMNISDKVVSVLSNNTKLVEAFCPDTLQKQRLWLTAISQLNEYGPDVIFWAMKYGADISPVKEGTGQIASDLRDWMKASITYEVFNSIPDWKLDLLGSQYPDVKKSEECSFITRPFNKQMSIASVINASNEWHDTVALSTHNGEVIEFSDPWYDGGIQSGFEIIPLTTSVALVHEGSRMRHCIRNYIERVRSGHIYAYMVKQSDSHVATFILDGHGSKPNIEQHRGFANAKTPPDVLKAIKAWLKKEQKINGNGRFNLVTRFAPAVDDFDDDVPF